MSIIAESHIFRVSKLGESIVPLTLGLLGFLLWETLRERGSTQPTGVIPIIIDIMKYSFVEISEIETRYNILLPEAYKSMLLLIGEKIIDFNKYTQPKNSKSICKIQEKIINSIKDFESTEEKIAYELNNVFYLTSSLDCDEDTKHYFIKSTDKNDCPVYCWTYYGSSGTNLIEKSHETIEKWLYEVSPILYVEWQVRKIFCDVSKFF